LVQFVLDKKIAWEVKSCILRLKQGLEKHLISTAKKKQKTNKKKTTTNPTLSFIL